MIRRAFCLFPIWFALLGFVCSHAAFAAEKPKKIVLIAGSITSHPKEAHEYEKNVILLKHLLDTSPDLQGKARVEAYFHGWPADPSTLDDADTIFLTSDGTDREEKNHPFYVGDHMQVIERQMKRGCGLVLFHWSTFSPMRTDTRITEWVGGHFDYETGDSPNHWYSAIQTWQAESKLGTVGHPILHGVKPFTTQEEYYYHIRFRDNDPRLKPIIVTRPPKETNDFTVGWAVERADGGRGFGFTGGHFYANWWNPDFRKLILNAIVWTAKLDVPKDGVRSEPFDRFKALILTGHNHPAHDWRATTAGLILALEQDPRTIVHVTENIEDLATDKINGYDLLVLNYCNWEQPGLTDKAKANFHRYLRNGGGLAIIHFANGAWHPSLPNTRPEDAWPEYYTKICRRVWEHRPPNASGHDAFGPFHVEIADVNHPIIAGLQPFETVDELYFHQQGDLPIEPLAYALSKTTGQREPLAWAYDYGKARVFQTVLGHSDESIRRAAALIRRGCVWAAGRGELSFDPPWQLTEGALFREGSPWTPQESLKRAAAVPPANKLASASNAQVQGGRAVLSAQRTQVLPRTGAPLLQVAAAIERPKPTRPVEPRSAGTPAIAGSEPESQGEKDWVDNRWSRTDVGPFLASSLKVPNGIVTKALTIRVGDHDEASVCFDTANLNVRAGWTGGFLQFDAARFGLLNRPKIDGQIQFVAPDGPGWVGAPGRFSGFRVHGKRVVLEYTIGDTTVHESPWFELRDGTGTFTRSLQINPRSSAMSLSLAIVHGSDLAINNGPQLASALWSDGEARLGITVTGSGVRLLEQRGVLTATFSANDRPTSTQIAYAAGTKEQPPRVASALLAALHSTEELSALLKPGTAHWLPALETTGHLAPDTGPLAIDTLTVPYDNPWNALMFLSGVDFTSDGAAYVCSIHGDVWKVTGIDDKLRKLTWKRFATGLYQALGLKVVNDQVYVLGRDQITRLHDENGDGEADFYEDYCNLIQTFPEPHHFVTSLETDAHGNFYYVDPVGVHRVSPDGRTMETIATGFRNPNGMGVSPDGTIVTVAPQQGEWTPSSPIVEAKPGGYYGYGGPKVTPDRPLGYDPVLCWIPHSVDNSGGSQVWVPKDHWGPLADHLLHFSWGRCKMMLVLRDVVEGVPQAATVALPGRFLSGAMRGAFNPRDSHLYVVGSTGWQTSALKDGSFQRVRYTGKPLDAPVAWHVHSDGLVLTFAQPLDKETAEDAGSYAIEQWNYRYAAQYGSKDWSIAHPNKEGHDTVEIRSAKLLADGRTVFLEIRDLKPVMQMQIQYNLNAKEGASVRGKLYATINRVGTWF